MAHVLEWHGDILCPDDGLLLGNGDLSVSVYQAADRIIWRFGKGDVWDRRIDRSEDPRPAHIDEVAHGIAVEGWKCNPYDGNSVEATKGTKDPRRMKELCQGCPPSYRCRPYPCPKPVGELALHLPADLAGLELEQRLIIEEARLAIRCTWPMGMRLDIDCFVPPADNVLVVRWAMEYPDRYHPPVTPAAPVWFSLYRWPDPSLPEFDAQFMARYRRHMVDWTNASKASPLPGPTVRKDEAGYSVEQSFPPDPTFPDGFQCRLAPVHFDGTIEAPDLLPDREALLQLLPQADRANGDLAIGVATSADLAGPAAVLQRLRHLDIAVLDEATRAAAREFWSRSTIRLGDPVIEDLWYAVLHARRCTYRNDTVPPGLFLPSSIPDYTHWHGDYHLNYNFQSPFWGDYAANHLELGDAYFQGMKYLLHVGRKIARDYYNARGVFIQLSGYPLHADDDVLGCVPMGRMAYMTGWAANQYWWRYLYTLDNDWLRAEGYPVLRDCALFYTDFLTKGEDGLYHAFPSNQGEDGFTGGTREYTDRIQVMQHMRYCLRAAIEAARVLDVDEDLRRTWQDRLDYAAGDDGGPPRAVRTDADRRQEQNPPEFRIDHPEWRWLGDPQPRPGPGDDVFDWYCGKLPWAMMIRLRAGRFLPNRDLDNFRQTITRWRRPNGLLCAMAITRYGRVGAWTESLGIIAPLQEMLLQSWDGVIRIFPAWPTALDAAFENLRAEGAFLVSTARSGGQINEIKILSEKGAECRIAVPWTEGAEATDENGGQIQGLLERDRVLRFPTHSGKTYRLRKRK